MNEEVEAYLEYLLTFGSITKPKMPKIDESAYTDNEYLLAIDKIMSDFDAVEDFSVYEQFLKGD